MRADRPPKWAAPDWLPSVMADSERVKRDGAFRRDGAWAETVNDIVVAPTGCGPEGVAKHLEHERSTNCWLWRGREKVWDGATRMAWWPQRWMFFAWYEVGADRKQIERVCPNEDCVSPHHHVYARWRNLRKPVGIHWQSMVHSIATQPADLVGYDVRYPERMHITLGLLDSLAERYRLQRIHVLHCYSKLVHDGMEFRDKGALAEISTYEFFK